MIFGVAYYPEHWPEERWSIDAQLMVELGLDVVRLAEFAWSKLEPQPGQYDWIWLDRVIDILSQAGLKIILGTPTAAPPAWLVRRYPEVLPMDEQGHVRQFGSRRHYCPNSPTYQEYSRQIVTQMAERYSTDSRVIGWQIDNEFGGGKTARCYCPNCAKEFRVWLARRYGELVTLNEAWGTVFWSQTYFEWSEIEPPMMTVAPPNPSHVLDYYRFSSDSIVAYQKLQVETIRLFQREKAVKQFITHNFMGLYYDLDQHRLAEDLDFAAWDNYPTGNPDRWRSVLYPDELDPAQNEPCFADDAGDPIITGMAHDLTRGLKGRPFWIMEQQIGPINWSQYNQLIQPDMVRLWVWQAVASGANGMVYFRWRACRFAQEQYHSGLLMHDASTGSGYTSAKILQSERPLLETIEQQPYQAEIAILLDYQDLWALQLQPHRKGFGYLKHLYVYYRALRQVGMDVDLVSSAVDLSSYKLVIAPTVHLVDETLQRNLETYVKGGGVLLLGVRSGFKTASNLVTDLPLPGLLKNLSGVLVKDWAALLPGAGYALQSTPEIIRGVATTWIEKLEPCFPSGINVLVSYQNGPYTGCAALAENSFGNGKVFTLGFYPTPDQARDLIIYLAHSTGLEANLDIPAGIMVYRRGRYSVLLNFTENCLEMNWDGRPVKIPGRDLALIGPEI